MPVAPKAQPFKKHPLPNIGFNILAAAPALVKGAINEDVLLIPPPSADDVDTNGGSVQRLVSNAVMVRNSGAVATSAVTNVQVIYKAEGGREALVGNLPAAVLATGASAIIAVPAPFLLSSADLGVFLRVANVATVDAATAFADVRNPFRTSADITSVDGAISPANGNPALAQLLLELAADAEVIVQGLMGMCAIANFDSAAHTFHLYFSDGTNTIELTDTATPVSIGAGVMAVLPMPGNGLMPWLADGWSLKGSIGEAVVTKAPRVLFGYIPTNEAPARDDQSGAF